MKQKGESNKLFKDFTPEELAGAMVLTRKLKQSEKVTANTDLAIARKKVQAGLTESDRFLSKMLQFKLELDDYIRKEEFNPKYSFGFFLKEYVNLLSRKRKVFAREIDVKETELSQFINQHRFPPENIIIRLAIHSNNVIPAEKWFRLVEKQRIHSLMTNSKLRRAQKGHVKNKIAVSI